SFLIFLKLSHLADYPEIRDKGKGAGYYKFYVTPDTTLLSTLDMDAKWYGNNPDCKECFLLSDSTYTLFNQLGLLDKSTLTLKYLDMTLPIAGTVSNYPYDFDGKFILMISQGYPTTHAGILVPKKGRRAELAESLRMTIERNDPQLINERTHNFRDMLNMVPSMVEAARSAGWILGIVSLIICAMSIFSTIALDTRARRKEVAIRKVNGAKSADIYRMFGKMYAVVILISLIPAIPVCVIFNRLVSDYIMRNPLVSAHMSPVMPIVLGCLIVIAITAVIVGLQIYRVIQADPSKTIAKE
ncbi:MAG: ABC transporter permease, partial [Muribaculaceae bacterium]|nr:ABC transporter permease [Muribaculaceae bacterium]